MASIQGGHNAELASIDTLPGEEQSRNSDQQSNKQNTTQSSKDSLIHEEATIQDPEKLKTVAPSTAQEENPNVVFWDGPDDPENPVNFSDRVKWGNIAVLSILSTLTPLASSMFAPGVPELMEEFHSDKYES